MKSLSHNCKWSRPKRLWYRIAMWWLSWALVIALNTFLGLWYWREKRKYKDVDKIPGPPTKFFFGNNAEFGTNTEESFSGCQRLIQTYGPLVRVWQGPIRLVLFVTNPDHLEYFLSSNVHLKKSAGYRLLGNWIGQGLLTSTGEKWKRQRRILTPAFHFKILEQFSSIVDGATQILANNLRKKEGKPVDFHDYALKYALDVICESSMRVQVNAQEQPINEFIEASKMFMKIFFRRFFSVLGYNDFFFTFFPEYEDHKKCIDYLHDFTMKVVQQRKKERIEEMGQKVDDFGIKKKKAFLDILLDSNELSDEEIREQVDTFLFTGHDTIASAISFGLFELAKHPDIQGRLLDEIHEVIGVEKNTEITLKHHQDMKYLDCVIKEILRMYPAAPLIERELTEDIELDGMKIPSGTTISMHPFALHRNEKIFPNPERFDPDRFLPHNTLGRHPFAYIPFSAGARNCIGFKYATMNMKSVVVNVVRNFEINPLFPVHVPRLANEGVLKSLNGLPIILRSRK